MTLDIDTLQIGAPLPMLNLPAITRTTLALYAGASGDHNPVHIDIDFARQAGMPDVFAHGMLSMAYLGRMLTNWVPQQQIRSFGARFVGITNLGDRLQCVGRVVEFLEHRGERVVKIEIQTRNQDGETKVLGQALVGNPSINRAHSDNLNLFPGFSI
jgi:acyl dehydratase